MTKEWKENRRKYRESKQFKDNSKRYRSTEKYKAYYREYQSTHKHKTVSHDYHLKNKFNITIEKYETILKEQGGVCSVCRGENPSGNRLAVDHNHETGQVRGLLCHKCNTALGYADDNIYRLLQLSDYLLKWG